MALRQLLSIIIFAVICSSAKINITSPQFTNRGTWGPMERCPEQSLFAKGFQLKTQEDQGRRGDDTALNAIRLFCGNSSDSNTVNITSSQGSWGAWGTVYSSCYPGVLTGFRMLVDPMYSQLQDVTAANNVRFFCSSLPKPRNYIQGDGGNRGGWTAAQHCRPNQAICGIQTQVEPPQGQYEDDTSLNNVRFECCDYVNRTQTEQ